MSDTRWFTVASGPLQGRVRLVGWLLTAVAAGPGMSDPWVAVAGCPRCGALVYNNDTNNERTLGEAVLLHEDWHAATDFPRPPSDAGEGDPR
jgi:hypothetical protein